MSCNLERWTQCCPSLTWGEIRGVSTLQKQAIYASELQLRPGWEKSRLFPSCLGASYFFGCFINQHVFSANIRLFVYYVSTITSIVTSHMSFGQNVFWIFFKHSSQVHQFCCLSCWSKQTRLERTGWWTDEEFHFVCGFQRGCSYGIGRCYIIRGKTFLN